VTEAFDKAAEEGAAWLDAFLDERKIDREKLTKGDWFLLTREIPCTIRCWRIGVPVDCGKLNPIPDVFERLRGEDVL
jgi:hypothetical protein